MLCSFVCDVITWKMKYPECLHSRVPWMCDQVEVQMMITLLTCRASAKWCTPWSFICKPIKYNSFNPWNKLILWMSKNIEYWWNKLPCLLVEHQPNVVHLRIRYKSNRDSSWWVSKDKSDMKRYHNAEDWIKLTLLTRRASAKCRTPSSSTGLLSRTNAVSV